MSEGVMNTLSPYARSPNGNLRTSEPMDYRTRGQKHPDREREYVQATGQTSKQQSERAHQISSAGLKKSQLDTRSSRSQKAESEASAVSDWGFSLFRKMKK